MDQILFETALGYMGVVLRGPALLALVFGHSSESSARRALTARVRGTLSTLDDWTDSFGQADKLADRLREFALGEPIDFSDVSVDTRGATSFQRRVIDACREIPWGETRSYGQLAAKVGRPGAARAVGAVMAANRVPLVVPCHRVVAASGGLGGFSAPQGLLMKRRLLAAEHSLEKLAPERATRRTLAATR
jgi:methylated-DNA-[protein]-cysteine S-methyltransferase